MFNLDKVYLLVTVFGFKVSHSQYDCEVTMVEGQRSWVNDWRKFFHLPRTISTIGVYTVLSVKVFHRH